MSEHQAVGLSVQVYAPAFGTAYTPKNGTLGKFDFSGYDHTLTSGVGFDTMGTSRACSVEEAYWWLGNACGAHVEVQDETAVVVWEGRVDTVSVSTGGFSIQRGPLSETANRCVVTYQLMDPGTGLAAWAAEGQEQKRTLAANHTVAQAKYGIQTAILSAGLVTTDRANNIRDTYAILNSWPRVPKQLSLGGGDTTVSLACKGYYHWLNYPYRLANTTAIANLSDKIVTVLAADPNHFFDMPNQIATNTLWVPALEDQDRSASEIISDMVALGDAAYNRYTFGVWQNREARYGITPTIIEYQQRADDKRQAVEDMGDNEVRPWAVLPDKWITFTNVLPGSLSAQVGIYQGQEQERAMFIESVKYSSPAGLTLQGGQVNTLKQRLAQWGLTGI